VFGVVADDYVETHKSMAQRQASPAMAHDTEYCQPIWSAIDQIATADAGVPEAAVDPRARPRPRLRGRIKTVIDAARALGHVGRQGQPGARKATSITCCRSEQARPDNHHRPCPTPMSPNW
jgi:hypothetical protein